MENKKLFRDGYEDTYEGVIFKEYIITPKLWINLKIERYKTIDDLKNDFEKDKPLAVILSGEPTIGYYTSIHEDSVFIRIERDIKEIKSCCLEENKVCGGSNIVPYKIVNLAEVLSHNK